MTVVWLIPMVAIAAGLAVFARGLPRVLSLVALAVTLLMSVVNLVMAPLLVGWVGVVGTGLVLGLTGVASKAVVLALFIAAAAIASRPRTAGGLEFQP